jgi:16S rRNA processing protein RimM
MARDDYKFLGSVVKTHGISGEVVIRSKIPVTGMNKDLKSLMVKIDGLLVPFSIISLQFITDTEIIVVFRNIDSKNKAEILKDKDIFILQDEIKNASVISDMPDLSGYKVKDIRIGDIGKVTGIMEVPGNDLLKIEFHKREILLPIQEGLILEIDSKKKMVKVDLPEGFLEI